MTRDAIKGLLIVLFVLYVLLGAVYAIVGPHESVPSDFDRPREFIR